MYVTSIQAVLLLAWSIMRSILQSKASLSGDKSWCCLEKSIPTRLFFNSPQLYQILFILGLLFLGSLIVAVILQTWSLWGLFKSIKVDWSPVIADLVQYSQACLSQGHTLWCLSIEVLFCGRTNHFVLFLVYSVAAAFRNVFSESNGASFAVSSVVMFIISQCHLSSWYLPCGVQRA